MRCKDLLRNWNGVFPRLRPLAGALAERPGTPMQEASLQGCSYKADAQLSLIGGYMTLKPGDILFTGSPSGSAGVHGDRWLRHGDPIRAEIASAGVLDVSVHEDR